MKLKKQKKLSKKLLLIVGAGLILITGGAVYWLVSSNYQPETEPAIYSPQPETSEDDRAQQQTSNSAKNESDTDIKDQNNSQSSSSLRTVPVIITDASQYDDTVEVRAYATEVSSRGNCVITFTRNGHKFFRNVTALPSSTTTMCSSVDVPVNDFPEKGTWQINVRYTSNSGQGTSASRSIEVQ